MNVTNTLFCVWKWWKLVSMWRSMRTYKTEYILIELWEKHIFSFGLGFYDPIKFDALCKLTNQRQEQRQYIILWSKNIQTKFNWIWSTAIFRTSPSVMFSPFAISVRSYLCNKIPLCYWLWHKILSSINQSQPS